MNLKLASLDQLQNMLHSDEARPWRVGPPNPVREEILAELNSRVDQIPAVGIGTWTDNRGNEYSIPCRRAYFA